jgi:hypothetical protein
MKFLYRVSILYLIFPFLLFLFGWVRLSIAIPLSAIVLFAIWRLFKNCATNHHSPFPDSKSIGYWLLITAFWVALSGVGGYAFQNWDHHWRNAVFRDLIKFDWPVYYTQPESGPVKMLVYYVGYWLPSAWVGRFLGWKAANFALFLWTLPGVLLVTLHLASALKTSPLKASLLLILFSGLDSIGTLFFAKEYPSLLPPVTHLEIWAGNLQYSSFTTQLFWVFNQAVPAWLCVAMIVVIAARQSQSHAEIILLWSLCFFFAPLVSLGLLPYVLIELIKQTDFKSPFKNLRWEILPAAAIILLLSTFYFLSNTAAQQRGLQAIPFADFLAFFLLEGGILWFALAPVKWRDPRWMVTGLLLLVIPFIQLGSDRDFVMRVSIAPLFYLMLMAGETIFDKTTPRLLLAACYLLLVFGSLTPLYEINRSVYRTYEYYLVLDEDQRVAPPPKPAAHLEQAGALELEHPGALTADEIISLQFMEDKLSKNFIANVRQTVFYRYFLSR